MRPSGKTWSLTVRAGSLHLDAPHGSFAVRAVVPEVMPVIAALPEGTDVECEGMFDGGSTITNLVVTKVRRILKDMSGRVMELPDAIVGADGRLAAARARKHFEAGRIDDAARDVASLFHLGDDQAIGEFERLPDAHRKAMIEQLVEWQAERPATWRALKHVSLERWTVDHLDQAVEHALASGGVFGAGPGVRAEILLEELERRQRPTTRLSKQTQRLRRAQATEGDTFYRITTDLDSPRVVGADHAGVYIAGTAKFGEQVVQVGAQRKQQEDRRRLVVQYALDGSEIKRWLDIAADRIVEGVALRLEADEPSGVRLADGKTLFTFAHRIQHHDGELLWGVHARDVAAHRMSSEIRHIATGLTIATFEDWVTEVRWDAKHIFIYGDHPQTLTREGRLVKTSVPPPPETIEIETANGRSAIPAAHAPWNFGHWQSLDAGGWILHGQGRQLFLAPSEPNATWVHLEFAKDRGAIELAPPWLAVHDLYGGPILVIALAEAMSAAEIRVDGKRFAKRAKADPALVLPPAVIAWYEAIVAAGVTPKRSDVERDAHLFRALEGGKITDDAITRVLVGHSPSCITHSDFFVDADDTVFADLTALLGDVEIKELERTERTTDTESDEEDEDEGVMLTIQASRGGKTLKRQSGAGIANVMGVADALLAQLGSSRRIFALVNYGWNRRAYLVITPEQRRALVAANIQGIHASAR